MTPIDLNNANQYPIKITSGTAQVWTKPRWSDAFTLRPDLTPVQSVWVVSPDFSTAALEYRYGRVIVPGAREYSTLSKITTRGYWVLIRWQSDNGSPLDWLGYAETPVTRDHYPARDNLPETGKQSIRCYGLMRALQHTIIDTTVYVDPANDTDAKRSGGTGSEFNAGMRGNRSKQKRKLDGEGTAAYVFAHPNDDEATWWSTRDIVEHLATFHLPTPASVAISGGVPWQVSNLAVLPSWDRPSISTDLRAVSSILQELIEPSKMLNYGIGITVTADAVPAVTAVTINPYSLLADPLTLPAGTLPANSSQFALQWSKDPLTQVVIDADSSSVYDQVIVQGPREIAVCTLNAFPINKSTHEKGWESTDEDKYSDGARLWSGFAAASASEKRSANENYRKDGKLKDVYSLYRFKKSWNGKTGDNFLFVPAKNDEGDDVAYIPSPLAIEILDYLPLYAEVNYMGDPAAVDEAAGLTLRKPVFALRKRNPDGSISATRIYMNEQGRLAPPTELIQNRTIKLEYEFEDGLNIRLIVRDAPQHAIAGKEFVGNLGDLDQETAFGNLTHAGWELTVAIRGDRRPRYSIPAPSALANLDVVRRKVVTLDDESLASVYIAKDAIVGFTNNTPNTVTSTGGLLRDPTPILQSLCTMLARQHGQPRQRVTIDTARRLPQLQLGSMLTQVETASGAVDATITEIRIDAPMSEGDQPPKAPRQTFIASPYRADVLSLLRTPVGDASRNTNSRRRRPTGDLMAKAKARRAGRGKIG